MNLKNLLLTLSTLFLLSCNSNAPTPSSSSSEDKAFRHTNKSIKSQAILKLDTKGHTGLIKDVILTKSGDIISASDDKTIRVWSSKTGKEKRKILGQIGAGNEGKPYAIALSPNEEFLAVGGFINSGDNERIRIYNYQTGKLLDVLKSHRNVVTDLAFSSDGKYLISGSHDNTSKIWRSEDFRLIDTLKFHTNHVYAVKIIKKNNKYFALTAGYDHRVILYDMQSKKIVKSDKRKYKLQDLATSNKHIAICGFGKEIQIYDHALNPVKTIASETKPLGLAFSPKGDFLIAGTKSHPFNVNIYSVKENYKRVQSFQKHTNLTQGVAFLDKDTAISTGGIIRKYIFGTAKVAESKVKLKEWVQVFGVWEFWKIRLLGGIL